MGFLPTYNSNETEFLTMIGGKKEYQRQSTENGSQSALDQQTTEKQQKKISKCNNIKHETVMMIGSQPKYIYQTLTI